MNKHYYNEDGFTAVEFLFIFATLVIIGVAGYFVAIHIDKKPSSAIKSNQLSIPTWTGTVTYDGCSPISGDVGCYITVNGNIKITVMHGNTKQQEPWGLIVNSNTSITSLTGKKVKVYAQKIDGTDYTLEGSANYYVAVIN